MSDRELPSGNPEPPPEPSRIDIDEPVAAIELDPDPGVDRLDIGVQQERAGHAQVGQQERLVVELPHQVLAAAPDAVDAVAAQLVLDLGRRERTCPPRVEDLDTLQRAPLEVGRELAADRLDFGQLGHEIESTAAPRAYARRCSCARGWASKYTSRNRSVVRWV